MNRNALLMGRPGGQQAKHACKHVSCSDWPAALFSWIFHLHTATDTQTQQEMPKGSPVLFQVVLLIRLTDSLVFSQKVTIPITCCLPSLQELLGAFSSVSWQIF